MSSETQNDPKRQVPERYSLATLTHGSYLLDPGEAGEGAPLLVGCHGYAENASKHFAELKQIPGVDQWLVCAVEGLHRFYHPRTQEVIGSWMTRENRELAIADNARWVAAVVGEVRRRYQASETVVYAGFSQGVAMAYRAAAHASPPAAGLIALAGDVPPEIAQSGRLRVPPVLLGRGTGDQWYDEAKMNQDLEVLEAKGVDVDTHVFEAGHEWTDEFRERAGEFLAKLL